MKKLSRRAICVSVLEMGLWSGRWHLALRLRALQSPFWLNSAQSKLQQPRWVRCLVRQQAARSISQQTDTLQKKQKDLRKSSRETSA